jgi:hypothetical protein
MGHQVNFFVLPADLPAIEATIRSAGDVCFLEDRTPTEQPVVLDSLAFDQADMGHRPLRAYIARESGLAAVQTRFIGAQGYWLIDATVSPVIEFDRCFFDGSVLRRGRAYFASDLRFRPELPDPDFVRWGDRALSRIKKALQRAPDLPPWIYVSAAAEQWIRDNHAVIDGGAISVRKPPAATAL